MLPDTEFLTEFEILGMFRPFFGQNAWNDLCRKWLPALCDMFNPQGIAEMVKHWQTIGMQNDYFVEICGNAADLARDQRTKRTFHSFVSKPAFAGMMKNPFSTLSKPISPASTSRTCKSL